VPRFRGLQQQLRFLHLGHFDSPLLVHAWRRPGQDRRRHFVPRQASHNDFRHLTGGEPSLNPGLFKILAHAREKFPNAFLFLLSNGRRFSYRNYAEQLARLDLRRADGNPEAFRIGVPLYSSKAEIHDSITRAPGSFGQAVAGIKNLLSLGFKVEIRNILTKQNYAGSAQFAKFVAAEFPKAERVVFINAKYTGNALKNREKAGVRLSDAISGALKALPALSKAGIPFRLFHFPLCLLPREHWPAAEGTTKEDAELVFAPQCASCAVREKCARIWKSYAELFGFGEFKPVLVDE